MVAEKRLPALHVYLAAAFGRPHFFRFLAIIPDTIVQAGCHCDA